MFSFFSKHPHEIVAIFDVGNGSVGGALVSFNQHGIPTILYTHREPLTYLPHATSKRLLTTMVKLVGSVAHNLHKEGIPYIRKTTPVSSIKHGFCVFSSPWYTSETQVKKNHNDTPFTVTQKYIDDSVHEEEQKFLASLKGANYEKMFGPDIQVLEKKIIHTKLNGYEVEHPFDKIAKDLEITFFSSYISRSIIAAIEQTLHHYSYGTSIQFHSYALASWNAVRDIYPGIHDFLFVDITGEVTDIMLTQNTVLHETHSFPLGRNMVLRKIVNELGVSPEVALSFLSTYTKKSLDKVFEEKMKNIMSTSQEFWIDAFMKTIVRLNQAHMLPTKMFITADADVAPFFYEALTHKLPKGLHIPVDGFDVVVLNPEEVKHLAHIGGGVRTDTFLSIESEFLNKIAFDIV